MPAIIVNNPGYNSLQRKLIEQAFIKIKGCPKDNKSLHCSFLVRRNRIVVGKTNNEVKTHSKAVKYHYYANRIHAELACLVNFPYAPRELRRYDLYNIRINRHNQVCLAKPCRRCLNLISAYGLKDVYFTDEIGMFQRLVS